MPSDDDTDRDGDEFLAAPTFLLETLERALLLTRDQDEEDDDSDGESDDDDARGIHAAVRGGCVQLVHALLRLEPACVYTLDTVGHTPAHVAASRGFTAILAMLHETAVAAGISPADVFGATVLPPLCEGLTPMVLACRFGHQDAAAWLLAHGASTSPASQTRSAPLTTPLAAAARSGRADVVAWLLDVDPEAIDRRNADGSTPLMVAAVHANLAVVELLVARGANVQATDGRGWTAAALAAYRGHVGVLRVLLPHIITIDDHRSRLTPSTVESSPHHCQAPTTRSAPTPLIAAASRGHLEVVQLLVDEGRVDLEETITEEAFGVTALAAACWYGHDRVVEWLIAQRANVYVQLVPSAKTPLHLAVERNHVAIVRQLLQAGVLVNAQSAAGFSPLHVAAFWGRLEITGLLIDRLAEVDSRTERSDGDEEAGLTPLMLAAAAGHTAVVTRLLRAGALANVRGGPRRFTPLHFALGAHVDLRPETLWPLLEHSADVAMIAAADGCTPLHLAAELGAVQSLDILVAHGADVHATTEARGFTPAHVAAWHGQHRVLEHLDRSGLLDWSRRTAPDGWSLLYIATRQSHPEIVRFLVSNKGAGALCREQINAPTADDDGETPLYAAARGGSLEIVECLLQDGDAEVNGPTRSRRTPLMAAAEGGHVKILRVLARHGARLDATADNDDDSTDGVSALVLGAKRGAADVVSVLLELGARASDAGLLAACAGGHEGVVAELLRHGARPQASARDGATGVFLAAQRGHLGVLDLLLRAVGGGRGGPALVNAPKGPGLLVPMHVAAEHGHAEVLARLLAAGANVHATTASGATALDYAARGGHEPLVVRLLAVGARADGGGGGIDRDGQTPLLAAAHGGHLGIVQRLVAAGAYVHARRADGASALYLATRHRHPEIARWLVGAAGADPRVATADGSTPVLAAAQHGDLELVVLLCQRGANPRSAARNDGVHPLFLAALNGHLPVVEWLVRSCRVPVAWPTRDRSTPVLGAAQNGHVEVVRFLVAQCGADPRAPRVDGITPLYIAAANGHLDIVQLLLLHGRHVVVDALAEDGTSPLHAAAEHGHLTIVRALCEAGAKTELPGANGETPLGAAARGGRVAVVRYLLERWRANTEAPTVSSGSTPLHVAAQHGHLDVVMALLDHGARVDARRKNEMTPLHVAAHFGHVAIVQILVVRGAELNATGPHDRTPAAMAHAQGHTHVAKYLQERGGRL